MALLTSDELNNLTIDRMIFHLIDPSEQNPVYFPLVEAGGHESFFLDQVREANHGSSFDFKAESPIVAHLAAIEDQLDEFEDRSKQLADAFRGYHNANTKVGVFILMRLLGINHKAYAIAKFDNLDVMRYRADDDHVVLERIRNNIVQSKEAMQKSALIKVTPTGQYKIVATDRYKRKSRIGQFFRQFLSVDPSRSNNELTSTLHECIISTARNCKTVIASENYRARYTRTYACLSDLDGFDPEEPSSLLRAVFGNLTDADYQKVEREFRRQLKSAQIEDESFEFDTSDINQPRKRLIKTSEGISIYFDQGVSHKIDRTTENRIVINTDGVEYEGDDPDQSA